MLKLLLIRHGETDWNFQQKNQGQTDIPLNETGKQQSNLLNSHLQTKKIDFIYSSDLVRCIETANKIAEQHTIDVIQDIRLRERNYGKWEGLTPEEIQTSDYDNFMKYHLDPAMYSPSGGETGIEVFSRVTYFLSEILNKHKNGNIAIVSHGGTIAYLISALLHATPSTASSLRFDNCSITEVHCLENGRKKLIRFNDTSHLTISKENKVSAKLD